MLDLSSPCLGRSLNDEQNLLVRGASLLEVMALGNHSTLGDVHQPQEVDRVQLDRHKNLFVDPRLSCHVTDKSINSMDMTPMSTNVNIASIIVCDRMNTQQQQ